MYAPCSAGPSEICCEAPKTDNRRHIKNYNSMRVTGLEPVKMNTEKPFICEERCNYGTFSAYHLTSLCYKIPFRVAFCTPMQHGNATRIQAAGTLLVANKKRLDFCFSHRSSRRFILIWYISTNLFYLAIQYFT